MGERLNSIIVFLLTKIKKRLKFKNQEIDMFELITVECILTITIVLFASYVFVKNENWSYFGRLICKKKYLFFSLFFFQLLSYY